MKKIIALVLIALIHAVWGADRSVAQHGFPETIKIKTPTQTFNRYFYLALHNGRIFYKPNTETTGIQSDWQKFLGTGLPNNRKIKHYPVPSSISEIHADADEIVALSDTGRFYWLRVEKGVSWDGKVWNHLWGWPEAEPLFLKGRGAKPRAWGIGRRNGDVLYHEDIDGNQHHFGTMGITTLYVLTATGREICFTDSGLPADFSHSITLPDRGRFIAVNMSVSASTLFVINAAGKMYTRLVDFDTIGSDPMFFKYTYRREKREGRGEDWNSNFTPWTLPAEDWRQQPDIQLDGQAVLSSMITILQNGRGNAARELRVAGKNTAGRTGYYHKKIFDERWAFTEDAVPLDESTLLHKGLRETQVTVNEDIHYYGKIRTDGKYVPAVSAELVDFNLSESPCTLRLIENGNVFDTKLHTVEAWIHLKRNDPGRDGTAKVFLGTLEIPDDHKSRGKTFQMLRKYHLKTFRFIVEATTKHVYVRTRSSIYGDMELIFTAKGVPIKNSMFIRTYAMAQDGFDKMANSAQLKIAHYDTLTRADIPMIQQKINLNREVITQIDAILQELERSSEKLRQSQAIFTAFNVIVHATGIFLIDKPKIWTATRHFGTILKGHKESSEYLYFAGKISHDNAARRINNRIDAYCSKIRELEGHITSAIFFSENFSDYFQRLGISNSELEFVGSKAIHATCDVTPAMEGQSFFLVHLGLGDEDEILTFLVKLPKLEIEINRHSAADYPAYGAYEAEMFLFETKDSKYAEELYNNIFSQHFSTRKKTDKIRAMLRINENGWQLYDISGIQRNQIWLKYTEKQ